jgi:aspartyl-tRNA(Asn)/glutamyl-tRNA(Gln) amidotransferase subunit A
MDLNQLTLMETAALISRREISPVELVKAYLERIYELDPQLNCFITATPETALETARAAEVEIGRGIYRGPLHGIPVGLKDLFETQGTLTTAGCRFFSGYIPAEDATVVRKLKESGAVFIGKLNMHEIALGVTNENPHYGVCSNPWDPARISGGSSGGSAAALAARLCLGALGSDTGGSIRIPASLCGIVGLKPTFGRISLRGVVPLSWNLDHAGPMGRRVEDVAALLQAIAGFDPDDPASVPVEVEEYLGSMSGNLSGWRVALAVDEFFKRADNEMLNAVQNAARVFENLGAIVEEVELPGAHEAAQANGLMVTSDAAAYHRERLMNQPQEFGADVLQRLQTGAGFTSTEYILARKTQTDLKRRLERFFEKQDILLTPATPLAAPLKGADTVERARQLTRFTAPFNLTGQPALSLPCGFTSEGLPLGLQIIGKSWSEAALLKSGYAYQQATEWHLRSPSL